MNKLNAQKCAVDSNSENDGQDIQESNYTSSIVIPADSFNGNDDQENQNLTKYAKISQEEAKNAALQKVHGSLCKISLENDDGNVVYSAKISTCTGVKDVKVDAGNGQILCVENEDSNEIDAQEIDKENFVKNIDNPYFPLKPGTTRVYEGKTENGADRNEMAITNQTKVILGINTTVVNDKVWANGKLIEETLDWYAQDKEGNVWYFGEDSKEFKDGKVVSTDGSWEAGVDRAKPGIVMKANPHLGDSYRQEYYAGQAEDMAEVVSLNESVSVTSGSFKNCLKTKEWTPLEPGVEENKYYALGIGTVLETSVKGGSSRMELVNVTTEQTH